MHQTGDELRQGRPSDAADHPIPEAYLMRQRLRNWLAGPVMSKRAALGVNMVRINASLDRGDRSEFLRLARERLFIRREWLD